MESSRRPPKPLDIVTELGLGSGHGSSGLVSRKSQVTIDKPKPKGQRPEKKNEWLNVGGDLSIKRDLLDRQILFIATDNVKKQTVAPGSGRFILGSQTLSFFQPPIGKVVNKKAQRNRKTAAKRAEKKELQKDLMLSADGKTQNSLPKSLGEYKKSAHLAEESVILSPESLTQTPPRAKQDSKNSGTELIRQLRGKDQRRQKKKFVQNNATPVSHDHRHLGLDDREQMLILAKLNETPNRERDAELKRHFPDNVHVQSIVQGYLDAIDPREIIINEKRRKEIYLPLNLKVSGLSSRLYVNPSLSKGTVQQFLDDYKEEDCETINTAACFLSSQVKGFDSRGRGFILLKHRDEPDLPIEVIDVDKINQSYEMEFLSILNHEFELAKDYHKNKINLHLPVYDYILFGVQLFLKNKITLDALNRFFLVILETSKKLINEAKKRSKAAEIDINIGSSFETLFENISHKLGVELLKQAEGDYAKLILTELGVIEVEVAPVAHKVINDDFDDETDVPQPKIIRKEGTEAVFVQRWLKRLTESRTNEAHAKVWQDLQKATLTKKESSVALDSSDIKETDPKAPLKTDDKEDRTTIFKTIKDIDDLFVVGNAAWDLIAMRKPEAQLNTEALEKLVHLQKLKKSGKLAKKISFSELQELEEKLTKLDGSEKLALLRIYEQRLATPLPPPKNKYCGWIFLDETENPIPRTAAQLAKCPEIAHLYNPVITISYIPRVITHNGQNKGVHFYQYRAPGRHNEVYGIFKKVSHRILDKTITPAEVDQEFVPTVSPKGIGYQ